MFSYWRDKRNGLCHVSLAGTSWPASFWERISENEYQQWADGGRKPYDTPVEIKLLPDEIGRAADDAMDEGR